MFGRGSALMNRVAIGVCAGAVLMAATARADDEAIAPPPGAGHLPLDGALLVSLRPAEIDDAAAYLDLLTGLYPGLGRLVTAVRAPLAIDAFSRTELAARGIDSGIAMLASVGRVEPGTWKDQRKPTGMDGGKPAGRPQPAPLVRHRLVVKAVDAARFAAFVRDVLGRLSMEVVTTADKKTPAWWTAWRGPANRARVRLAARGDLGAALILSDTSDGFAVLDLAVPARDADTVRAAKALQTRAFRLLLPLKPATVPVLSEGFAIGSRRLLGNDASFALVVQPNEMTGLLATPDCRDRWQTARGAFFDDAAIAARLSPFDWRMRLAFSPTAVAAAALGATGSDDGLLDPRRLAREGVAAVALYTASFAGVGALPAPVALARGWDGLRAEAESCGAWLWPIALARFSPHLLTTSIADVGRRFEAAPTMALARNVAMAMRDRAHPPVLMLSFPATATADLDTVLRRRGLGPFEPAAFGARTPRIVTLDERAGGGLGGLEDLTGSRVGLALGPAEAGLGWYYSHPRQPAVFGSRTALGAVHVNVGRILSMEAENADAATRDAVQLAVSQVQMLGGALALDRGLVTLDLAATGAL
jgi:hypothetical protein